MTVVFGRPLPADSLLDCYRLGLDTDHSGVFVADILFDFFVFLELGELMDLGVLVSRKGRENMFARLGFVDGLYRSVLIQLARFISEMQVVVLIRPWRFTRKHWCLFCLFLAWLAFLNVIVALVAVLVFLFNLVAVHLLRNILNFFL